MRRIVYYGWDRDGKFYVRVKEESPGFAPVSNEVALTRTESNKISNHMKFGKKTEERVIETVNGEEVK